MLANRVTCSFVVGCLALAGPLTSCAGPLPAGHERSAHGSALDQLLSAHSLEPLVGERFAADDDGPLTFLAAGHLYGRPGINRTLPAKSFVAKVDELAAEEPAFVALLGDFLRGWRADAIRDTLGVLAKLDAPVFNAPGNHDIFDRASYVARFGATWGGFRRGTSLFLFLDSELDPWSITGEQLDFLRAALTAAPAAGIRRAFVFSHRLLFAAGDSRYEVVFKHLNSRADWTGSSNFVRDVRPLLADFAQERELVWISGDLGVRWSYGLFHDLDERIGVRFVATGMGEQPWDNVLRVHIDAAGRTELERITLGDPSTPRLQECGLAAWKARFESSRPKNRKQQPSADASDQDG